MRIIQMGNIFKEKGFKNPQPGRIYSIYGIAPTLDTVGGGKERLKSSYGRKRND